MKRWLLITCMVVGGLIAAGPRNPIEAASCHHGISAGHTTSGGCPWQGLCHRELRQRLLDQGERWTHRSLQRTSRHSAVFRRSSPFRAT